MSRHEAPVFTGKVTYFGPAAKKFGATTFVIFHVGRFVTYYGMIGSTNRCQTQRIGGGTGENKKHFTIRLKEIANQYAGPLCPRIVPVTNRMPMIGLLQRSPSLWTNA